MIQRKARVTEIASQLRAVRELEASLEAKLMREVGSVVKENHGGLRDWARSMGISAQYACDIAHGRRKISDAILKKLGIE